MKRLLINTKQSDEIRIAIANKNQLLDLDIEYADNNKTKANIYKGKIIRIEPSLNATFVDFGGGRNGFLPIKEIHESYLAETSNPDAAPHTRLSTGQEIVVQILKEERGSKGAALTTQISLAGCYLVLMPNNASGGGISRRVEGEARVKMKKILRELNIPKGMSVIIRTAGISCTKTQLRWDLDILLNLWNGIENVSSNLVAPFLIQRESDLAMRALRDYLRDDIEEIVTDTVESYDELKKYLSFLRPQFVDKLKYHNKSLGLFSCYHLENQVETAFKREVRLQSGASIVIDSTEALTAIDVNSGQATKRNNIAETAFYINIEAAIESVKQMRLRDIGGLIIIDFIDMETAEHKQALEAQLIKSLSTDRARIQMTRISHFGLVEISRQRLKTSLSDLSTNTCPKCKGEGTVRTWSSVSLSVLRQIEQEANKTNVSEVKVQLPVDMATYLLNEQREILSNLETKKAIKIQLIPNFNLNTPDYNIQTVFSESTNNSKESHFEIKKIKETVVVNKIANKQQKQAVNVKLPEKPTIEELPLKKKISLLQKVLAILFTNKVVEKPKVEENKNNYKPRTKNNSRYNSNRRRRNTKLSVHKASEMIDIPELESNLNKNNDVQKNVAIEIIKIKKQEELKVQKTIKTPDVVVKATQKPQNKTQIEQKNKFVAPAKKTIYVKEQKSVENNSKTDLKQKVEKVIVEKAVETPIAKVKEEVKKVENFSEVQDVLNRNKSLKQDNSAKVETLKKKTVNTRKLKFTNEFYFYKRKINNNSLIDNNEVNKKEFMKYNPALDIENQIFNFKK